jgi:hypothetical protein
MGPRFLPPQTGGSPYWLSTRPLRNGNHNCPAPRGAFLCMARYAEIERTFKIRIRCSLEPDAKFGLKSTIMIPIYRGEMTKLMSKSELIQKASEQFDAG